MIDNLLKLSINLKNTQKLHVDNSRLICPNKYIIKSMAKNLTFKAVLRKIIAYKSFFTKKNNHQKRFISTFRYNKNGI